MIEKLIENFAMHKKASLSSAMNFYLYFCKNPYCYKKKINKCRVLIDLITAHELPIRISYLLVSIAIGK